MSALAPAAPADFVHIARGRFDADVAPLLLLHQTGGDEHQLLPLAERVAPDRALIAMRGPVIEQGRARFFRRHAAGVFDEADLRQRARDLASFVGAMVERHHCAPPVAVGVSNGANIATAMALLDPAVFSAMALLRPACPFLDLPRCRLDAMPVLLVAGRDDETVPPRESERLTAHLRDCGARVDFQQRPGGHRIDDRDTAILRSWLSGLEGVSQGMARS